MNRILILSLLINVALIAIFGAYVGYGTKHIQKTVLNQEKLLPTNIQSEVTVTRDRVLVRQQGKPDQIITIPKTGQVIVKTSKDLKVLVTQPNLFPRLCLLPQVGLQCASQCLEPNLGLQFLRVEPIQIGLSLNVSPSSASLSLERDVFSNGTIGLLYGIKGNGTTIIGVKLSLFL